MPALNPRILCPRICSSYAPCYSPFIFLVNTSFRTCHIGYLLPRPPVPSYCHSLLCIVQVPGTSHHPGICPVGLCLSLGSRDLIPRSISSAKHRAGQPRKHPLNDCPRPPSSLQLAVSPELQTGISNRPPGLLASAPNGQPQKTGTHPAAQAKI